jgi:hypothetical protein
VPCRRPEAEDIGGATPGDEVTGIDSASVVEAAYGHLKYEDIAGEVRNLTVGHCHSEKSDGDDTTTTSSGGLSLHPL